MGVKARYRGRHLPNDYYFLQPIDTWIRKVSKEIKLIDKDKIYKEEAKDITNKCFKFGVNPILIIIKERGISVNYSLQIY